MIIFLISFFLSSVSLVFCMYNFNIFLSVLAFTIIFFVTYFLSSKMICNILEKKITIIQKELNNKKNFSTSIYLMLLLKKKYRFWYFSVNRIINSQVGLLYYVQRKFRKSYPFLVCVHHNLWVQKIMLAALYFKTKSFTNMEKTFQETADYNAKENIIWSIWAYCKWKSGNLTDAIKILELKKNDLDTEDPKIEKNILLLKQSRKMNMKEYGEMWLQFHLEPPQTNYRKNVKTVR